MDIKTETELVSLAIQDWFGITSIWPIKYSYKNKGNGDVEIIPWVVCSGNSNTWAIPWVESIDSFIVHIY
jgi:hypothetical protein